MHRNIDLSNRILTVLYTLSCIDDIDILMENLLKSIQKPQNLADPLVPIQIGLIDLNQLFSYLETSNRILEGLDAHTRNDLAVFINKTKVEIIFKIKFYHKIVHMQRILNIKEIIIQEITDQLSGLKGYFTGAVHRALARSSIVLAKEILSSTEFCLTSNTMHNEILRPIFCEIESQRVCISDSL